MKTADWLKWRSDGFNKILEASQKILYHDVIATKAKWYLDERLSREAQLRHGFGFFPPDEYLDRIYARMDPAILRELNLVYPKYLSGGSFEHGHFDQHNLIMPFKDVYGNTISIVGRSILSSEKQKELEIPKYKYSFAANKQLYLYGIEEAKQAIIEKDLAICVEGQFDCIACHEAGIMNVVACGGAALLPFQFFLLRRYTNNLLLLLDGDEAGSKGKSKIKRRYKSYANVKAMSQPDNYKDIDEFLRNATPERRKTVIEVLGRLNFAV